MYFNDLNNENFLMYAVKAYEKPNCLMSEFKEDMKRFNYIKRLFHKYRKTKEIKEQLVLNHLMVIYNVFGVETATRMLFYKISKEDYSVLKTFLLFLNFMPNSIRGIKGNDIRSSDIDIDFNIANILRKIK